MPGARAVATAIGNAQSRAELAASRARIVAAADGTRRRIERDLHDGTQQRLVSLGLGLRLAQSMVPADLPELQPEIGRIAGELNASVVEVDAEASGGTLRCACGTTVSGAPTRYAARG